MMTTIWTSRRFAGVEGIDWDVCGSMEPQLTDKSHCLDDQKLVEEVLEREGSRAGSGFPIFVVLLMSRIV